MVKRPKYTEKLTKVVIQLPADVLRDTDHTAFKAKEGERKRLRRELKHKEKMEELASDERKSKHVEGTKRLRIFLVFLAVITSFALGASFQDIQFSKWIGVEKLFGSK